MRVKILFCLVFFVLLVNTLGAKVIRSNLGGYEIDRIDQNNSFPYDSEVEYLSISSDGPYINTFIQPFANITFDITFSFSRFSQDSLFGSVTGDNFNGLLIRNVKYSETLLQTIYASSFGTSVNIPISLGTQYNLKLNGRILLDGEDKGQWNKGGVGDSTNDIFLFAANSTKAGGAWRWMRGKIYGCKIGTYPDYGDLRDFIPVRFTNENGIREGAMYDLVSGELFRNQGKGSFGIGPDIQ